MGAIGKFQCGILCGLAALFWACGAAEAQISPGPLSRAHEQLEGVTHCASCHDFGHGSRNFKCLECHTEIRRRVEAHSGFHAREYRASAGETDCARCHMEHNGREFALKRLDARTFDHKAETGFALEGKHRQQKCEACHNEKRVAAAARAEIKVKNLNRTYLGLRRECGSCHEDHHQGQFGTECNRCHAPEGWRPASGFNHSHTGFPLTGLHQSVACEKCHGPRGEEKAARYKGLAFTGCQNCHNDPHRGAFQEAKFQGSCETCHNTGGWKNNHPNSNFNHSSTRVALLGKHATVECEKCHKSSDFHKPVAHERCQDCHEDPHRGQFAARAAGSDCSSCHVETGFKPAKFNFETHRRSAFPLEGKHAGLRCDQCHEPHGRDTVYKTGKLICSDCHADRHGGEFAGAPWVNRCEQCHTVDGFQPTTFTISRHTKTHFALAGKHESVSCHDCHKPLSGAVAPAAGAAAPLQYHFASLACGTCHADPHETKLACETCHTTQAWKPVSSFDHARTKFKLEGAHQKPQCIQCHRAGEKTAPVFARTPGQCDQCHEAKDVHGGQFRVPGREEDCALCHNPAAWNPPAAFNHDRTRFPLDVAHRNVACAKCHVESPGAAGKTMRKYRDTPVDCVKCH